MTRGIETAKLIPRGTSAYSAAREQIRTWREFLNPQPVPTPETPQIEPSTIPSGQ
jgi:hypothetical protein